MEVILALLLFIAIAVLLALIFIGYNLYSKNSKAEDIQSMLPAKENDLIELYQMLEQMTKEIDDFTEKAKSQISVDKEQVKQWRNEIYSVIMPQEGKPCEDTSKNNKEESILKENIVKKNHHKPKDLKEIKIKTLLNKGKSISDIAKELDIGQGEVQLILNLDKKIF